MENNIDNVIEFLEKFSYSLCNWLKNNGLENDVDKCNVLVSTNKPVGVKIGDYTIDNSDCEKLCKLKF